MPRTATRRYNESRNAPTVIVFSPLRFDQSFFSSFLFSLPSPFEIQRNSIRSNVWQYNIREKERNVSYVPSRYRRYGYAVARGCERIIVAKGEEKQNYGKQLHVVRGGNAVIPAVGWRGPLEKTWPRDKQRLF